MHKKRWTWSDAGSNEPVLRSPINRQQLEQLEQQAQRQQTEQIQQQPEPPSEPLDNFNDDKHVRENTYARMAQREPMVQMGTNPFLNTSYLDGITIRDKYLMPYHESKPRSDRGIDNE
jgi:hypothetical protein|uniref:Uncharacterized protein n=1 Tax=viral metagenome TaxID=1070528 RepID=A0A6C0IJT0_9ZZZZ